MDIQKSDLEIPDAFGLPSHAKLVYWKAPEDMNMYDTFTIETPSKFVHVHCTQELKKDDYTWFKVIMEERKENPELIKGM